jgi:putative FmdB family regulatory protein
MPIYEYICSECGGEFEELVLNSDEKVACPSCKCEKVEKKMSVFAHKNEGGFRSSSGSSACATCTAGTCSTCGK